MADGRNYRERLEARRREAERRERAKAEQARRDSINPGANSLGITDYRQWNNDNLFGMTEDEVKASGYFNAGYGSKAYEADPRRAYQKALQDAARTYRYNTDPLFKEHEQRLRRDAPSFLEKATEGIGGAFSNVAGAVEEIAPYAAGIAGLAYGGNALLGGASAPAAGAVNAAAPTAMTGTGVTGMGGASTLAGGAALNPMGSGFTGTGPGVSTAGLGSATSAPTGLSQLAGNALNQGSNMNWLDNALIAGGSLGSAYLSNEATGAGIDEISRQYDQTRADLEPWRTAGVNALQGLTNFDVDSVLNDPMYQLALRESTRAVNRGNSARGLNLSGNALIDEARTAAGISGDFGRNAWNRLAGLAGVGQTATNTGANLGANAAGNIANLNIQQGAGLNNALQGGISNYLTNNYLNRRYG